MEGGSGVYGFTIASFCGVGSAIVSGLIIRGCATYPGLAGIGGGERADERTWLDGGPLLPGKLACVGLADMMPEELPKSRSSGFPRMEKLGLFKV